MPTERGGQSPGQGQVVTFYSFKGGTGRTMALANVAWILAANGRKVLTADWDLESPGLHGFFQPYLDGGGREKPGIIDFIRRFEWAAKDAQINPEELRAGSKESRDAVAALIDEQISQIDDYAIKLNWEFPEGGALHFLSPGKQVNDDYQATLSALDWDNFYDNLYGGQFLDAFREHVKREYDYVLIDGRTGLSDIASICTVHLPDVVVDCFTLSVQGMEGAAMTAETIREHTDRDITILPVPMRIDHTYEDNVRYSIAYAEARFEGFPAGMSEEERRQYWAEVEVPYVPAYAYEEKLAAVSERPDSQARLLPSYELITARITGGAIRSLPDAG